MDNIESLSFNVNNITSNNKQTKDSNKDYSKYKSKIKYEFKPDEWFKYIFANVSNETRLNIINYFFNENLSYDVDFYRPNVEFSEYNRKAGKLEVKRLDTIYKDLNTGKKYHIEFQSTPDNMGLRVFLYGLYTGMEDMGGDKYN